MTPPVDYFGLDEVSEPLRRVIIVPRHAGKWLFAKAPKGLYVLPETEIAADETPKLAALRCMRQYIAPEAVCLSPVCIFLDGSYGMLFFAECSETPFSPDIVPFLSIPSALAEPRCTPFHFEWAQWWLNMQSNSNELWDVYDENRVLTGRTHRRGTPLPHGDYHLVVHVWIQNPDGTILLTQRAPNKGHPLLWECSGGSALSGDNSLSAALREVFEETGIVLNAESGILLLTDQREGFICDVWRFRQDVAHAKLRLQENETIDARFVSREELIALNSSSQLVPYVYFDALLNFL